MSGEGATFSHIASLEELDAVFNKILDTRSPTHSELVAHKAHRRVLKNRLSACRSRKRQKERDLWVKHDREMLLRENAALHAQVQRLEAKLRRWEGGSSPPTCAQHCSFPSCLAFCKEDHELWASVNSADKPPLADHHDCGNHGQEPVCGAPCELDCEERCPIPADVAHDMHVCRSNPDPCPTLCSDSACDRPCFEQDHLHILSNNGLSPGATASKELIDIMAGLEGSTVDHACAAHLRRDY